MIFDTLASSLLFLVLVGTLAWPLVERWALRPDEKLLVLAGLSLLAVWLWSWAVYVLALPAMALGLLLPAAALGIWIRRASLPAFWRDPDVRRLTGAQALVTVWCVGWLATVISYSGGGWSGDWFEHWQRAEFFLERWPLQAKFLADYVLTARPPLANVITGAFLHLTRFDFAHYQLISTLFASLAFLPAAVLARRWGAARAVPVLAVLFMVNPLFVENATFAWTKLPACFFVLAGLWFFLRAHDPEPPRGAGALCGGFLGAAVLAHYSGIPYVLLLGLGWLILGRTRWRTSHWRRETLHAALAGGGMLALWFAWALAEYGIAGTFLTNTSVTSEHVRHGNLPVKIILNFIDTLVPHFLRHVDPALIAQRSAWGWWRDWFFQCYQLNLLLACGCVGWIVAARESYRAARAARAGARWLWSGFIGGSIVLGTAVHGARDEWGLVHICLQPVVLLALILVAAKLPALPRGWRLALIAGATVDFVLGIALQFAAENFALDRWFAAGRTTEDILTSYNHSALMNLGGKLRNHLTFFADAFAARYGLVMALLAAVLLLALARARRVQE